MRQYLIGNEITLTATFSDVATGALTDPSDVVCRLLAPDGTESDLTPTSSATGIWSASSTPTMPGAWKYRWEATGTSVIAAAEGTYEVRPSAFSSPA